VHSIVGLFEPFLIWIAYTSAPVRNPDLTGRLRCSSLQKFLYLPLEILMQILASFC